MGLPMAFPGGPGKQEHPVAVTTQMHRTTTIPAFRERRLRGPTAEHRELGGLRVEIDDGWAAGFHFSLHPLTELHRDEVS